MAFSQVRVIDYATLSVTDTAAGLSGASPAITANVTQAIITLETAQVRWRADGTAPTSSEGHLLEIADTLAFTGANWQHMLNTIQFIRTGSTSGALKITYLGI